MLKKIDSLGRICIPCEYRKELRINCHTYVDINCDGKGIYIKKARNSDNFNDLTNNIIKLITSIYKYEVILTNTDKIIFSSIKELEGIPVPISLEEYFEGNTSIKHENHLLITESVSFSNSIYVMPILGDKKIIGLMIISSNKEISNEELKFLNHLLNLQ